MVQSEVAISLPLLFSCVAESGYTLKRPLVSSQSLFSFCIPSAHGHWSTVCQRFLLVSVSNLQTVNSGQSRSMTSFLFLESSILSFQSSVDKFVIIAATTLSGERFFFLKNKMDVLGSKLNVHQQRSG